MNFIKRLMGATNTQPAQERTIQTTCPKSNTSIEKLQALRDIAWQNANKYRWDPTIGKLHSEYLNDLNMLLRECEA